MPSLTPTSLNTPPRDTRPIASSVPGGIQVAGLDGIRLILVMDASGRLLALSRPIGFSTRIPLDFHGLLLVSFEDELGLLSNPILVQP